MIVTTTHDISGKKIVEYKEIVFGEVVTGINFLRDLEASIKDFFGGRSQNYEEELINARRAALREMQERAELIGANAIVSTKLDYEVLGATNGMMMVISSGMAVVVEDV